MKSKNRTVSKKRNPGNPVTSWRIILVLSTVRLNDSIWWFLLHLTQASKVSNQFGSWAYLLAGARLVNVFVFSRFLFTEMLKPGFIPFSPPDEIMKHPRAVVRLGLNFCFAMLFCIALAYSSQWIVPALRANRSPYVLIVLDALTITWGGWKLYQRLRQRRNSPRVDSSFPESKIRKAQSKAFRKFEQLSTEEQVELSELLMRVNTTSRISLHGIAKIVFGGLILSLLLEVAEVLLSRL